MALIVRSPSVKINGENLNEGDIIPKEYETDPDRDWSSAINLGRVDRIPDSAVDGDVPKRELNSDVDLSILSQSVSNLKDDLENVSNLDSLEQLAQVEKNNQNRVTAVRAINNRKEVLLNKLSGEE